ncbi:MAG TPA: EVE domain-containing protein [Caulobacteraceae bacterium]|jgi:predicted RNA-binding protein with PUA-like domain
MTEDEARKLGGRWLIKSEPKKYGWDDLVREGETNWDGVRNAQAAIYLRAMRKGDQALFYHSVEGLAVVGIAQVVRESFPDPTDSSGRYVAVAVAPLRPLEHPVTLARMKSDPRLSGMAIFRQFRLSVAPVTAQEWEAVLELTERGEGG